MSSNPVGLHNVGYNPYAAPQQSLIDQKLNQARQATSQTPFKGIINYADMWFNLRNNPQLPIKISEEIKWQLYFICGATKDANGDVKFTDPNGKIETNYFSIDHLKTDDLIMLFRIVISSLRNAEEQNMSGSQSDRAAFMELIEKIPEKIIHLGKQNPQAKAEILQKIKAQHAPEFDDNFCAHFESEMKSEDERTLESLERDMSFLIEKNFPESVIQAHMEVMECFKTKNPILNLSQIELNEIPPSLRELSHVKTVYLNLSSEFSDGFYFNPHSFPLQRLQNLDEIGFLRAPFTEKKLQLHKELNAWAKEVRGTEEHMHRIAAFFKIIRNYETSEAEDSKRILILEGFRLSSLPACLKELTHLETIRLIDCEFTRFPECILHLANLRVIEIFGGQDYVDEVRVTKCEMKEIPKEIANLTHLERFVISNTKITTLPAEMASIETLRVIEVNNNKITFIPNTLARMSWHATIIATGNPLNEEWLVYFKTLLETTRRDNYDLGPHFTHEEAYGFGGYGYQAPLLDYPAFQAGQHWNPQFGQDGAAVPYALDSDDEEEIGFRLNQMRLQEQD